MTPPSPVTWIRAGLLTDRDTIVDFNQRLAQETEGKNLDPLLLSAGVGSALVNPDRLRYWVAEPVQHRHQDQDQPETIVGQAAVTREWSDWRNGWIWWFQSVYVIPEFRSRGVFRALYHHIREEALAEPDVIGLRLYVEEENHRAQQTYKALGMKPGGYHVFEEIWPARFTAAAPPSA